ncbi:MAG: efflux transporter periplasmic adaptor subunit, partial [Flavobacteriaceae bacterium]
SMGALQDEKFNAKLKFIAPKGVEEEGAVQFRIEGDLAVSDSTNIRAGYSANAAIVLEEKKDVLSIKEALLQFDKETNKPYVEIEIGENEFEKRELELGVSDGIDVEIISGIDENSKIKIWNKLEAKSNGDAPNED